MSIQGIARGGLGLVAALVFIACRDVSAPGTDDTPRPGTDDTPQPVSKEWSITLSLPPERGELREWDTVTVYARVVDHNGVAQPSVEVNWLGSAASRGPQTALAHLRRRGDNIISARIETAGRPTAMLRIVAAAVTGEVLIWNPDGTIIRIPAPGVASDISPEAINDVGQVVGSITYGGVRRAFVWSAESGYQDPDVSQSGEMTGADINNDGVVAGTMGTGPSARAFIWSAKAGLLVIPGGPASVASINQSARVAGTRDGNPFMWTRDGGFVPVIESGAPRMGIWWYGVALNDYDEVLTSWSGPYDPGIDYSFADDGNPSVWSNGKLLSLDCPTCVVAAMNNRREVVGIHVGGRRAFRWTQEKGVEFLSDANQWSEAIAINEFGNIAGSVHPSWGVQTFSQAAVWNGTNVRFIQPVPGIRMTAARDINNRGQVLVFAK